MYMYIFRKEEGHRLSLEKEERHQQEEQQHWEEEKRRQEADFLLSNQQTCVTSDRKDNIFICLLRAKVLQYRDYLC